MPLIDYLQPVYDRVLRPYLPRAVNVCNGVPALHGRLLDRTLHQPDYKQGTVRNLRKHVQEGDRAIVIGGGRGVTAVVAWRQGASVTVYEAAAEMCEVIGRTLDLNRCADAIGVVHATVGPAIDVYGETIGYRIVAANLPECDVLEMDCEGAEGDTLADLAQRPRVVIVEVHPQFGTDEATVREWFDREGYTVTDRYEHDGDSNVTLTGVRDDHD